jgi:hypothetical protein
MDVLNFISWVKGSRIVTSVDGAQTLLPVGLKDPKRDDGYLAGAISVADFVSVLVPTYTNEQNVNIGYNTGLNTDENSLSNVVIGSGSGVSFTGGSSNNIAIGHNALPNGFASSTNIAIGQNALLNNTSSSGNIIMGADCGYNTTTGSINVAIGQGAFTANTVGSNNVAIGWWALRNNSTGIQNTAIGSRAGANSGNVDNTISIGADSTALHNGSIVIGIGAISTTTNQFVIGSSASNAGTIVGETITPNRTWTVRINGANYKIPLLAI